MNSIMSDYYRVFQMYQAPRDQMMELLTDEDLRYTPGGANPALGALCREIGEVERSYIDSFKTFTQDFSYRNAEAGLEGSVSRLAAWFNELDDELEAAVAALSEEDIESRPIERGGDFKVLPRIQLEIYKEALLIFYGKASVYLQGLGKELPQQWKDWIL